MAYSCLLSGIDSLYVSYYLQPKRDADFSYDQLSFEKEKLLHSKTRDPKVIQLGNSEFQLSPYGSSSGFPYHMESEDFDISFGPNNNPSFYVKLKCLALWQQGATALHEKFIRWCDSAGLRAYHAETLSRVDFCFDFSVPQVDFTEDHFLSQSKKDSRYRKNGVVQTIQLGKSEIILRVYDKVAEINEQSHKTWFFDLWECNKNVWRVEWQVRNSILKRFGIYTFTDLENNQGDLLRYLAEEHDSLRVPCSDHNRSRWPVHSLWTALLQQISQLEHTGIYREIDTASMTEERLLRIVTSLYGNMKQIAALTHRANQAIQSPNQVFDLIRPKLLEVHNSVDWELDVQKRINQLRFE